MKIEGNETGERRFTDLFSLHDGEKYRHRLKFIWREVCTGLIWLRIGPSVGCSEYGTDVSGCIKFGNFLSAERLSRFQERPWSSE
jgi:hypothetical protein